MKLHQLLAFEKDVRKRTQAVITEIHRDTQNDKLFHGVHKHYEPIAEGGYPYPDEKSPVTIRHGEALKRFCESWIEETDIVERKDKANIEARADVIVDNVTIALNVPATHLLFLEKQLEHVQTVVNKMVELPIGTEWTWDEQMGLHRSPVKVTHKGEKAQKPIVLYDATEKHPAQTQLITQDEIIGHWRTTNYCGAIPVERKRVILERVGKLRNAVIAAREEANSVQVSERGHSSAFMDFIFSS